MWPQLSVVIIKRGLRVGGGRPAGRSGHREALLGLQQFVVPVADNDSEMSATSLTAAWVVFSLVSSAAA